MWQQSDHCSCKSFNQGRTHLIKREKQVIFCVWLHAQCFRTSYPGLWAPKEEQGDQAGMKLAFVAQVGLKEEGGEVGRGEHLYAPPLLSHYVA